MAVRFKFRSSPVIDAVNLGGRHSISVRDLKDKIAHLNNLKIFDLVISDAKTGEAFVDEDHLVTVGSEVVVRRVPPGRESAPLTLELDRPRGSAIKEDNPENLVGFLASSSKANMEDFEDFGFDLYSFPLSPPDGLDQDDSKMLAHSKYRSAETFLPLPCKRGTATETISRGNIEESCSTHIAMHGTMQKDLDEEAQRNIKIVKSPVHWSADPPGELKCCLCNTIFREAVMVPCCQHSFCKKCICLWLTQKKGCPKCFSFNCGPGDLLPNISLRLAIERLLKSCILTSGSDEVHLKGATESGARGSSCALSPLKGQPISSYSPCATGKGSNLLELVSGQSIREDKRTTCVGSSNHVSAMKSLQADMSSRVDQCGDEESEASIASNIPQERQQALPRGKAYFAGTKRGSWVHAVDENELPLRANSGKKVERNCFWCGSRSHLIKDCPATQDRYPMFETGNSVFPSQVVPFWQCANDFRSYPDRQSMVSWFPNGMPIATFAASSPVQPRQPYSGVPFQHEYPTTRISIDACNSNYETSYDHQNSVQGAGENQPRNQRCNYKCMDHINLC